MTRGHQPIPRATRPSAAEFQREYATRKQPVILRGMIDEWPAKTKWTPEFFGGFGQTELPVVVWNGAPETYDVTDYVRTRARKPMSLAEFVQRVETSGPSNQYYISNERIFELLPQLRRDVKPLLDHMGLARVPLAVRRHLVDPPRLWFGPGGTISPLHFDPWDNFLVQIHGTKQVTLVPPSQTNLLYYPDDALLAAHAPHVSPIDVEAPSTAAHPLAREIEPMKDVLHPGEVLFIPAGHWHHVRSLETSISLNFWWRNVAAAQTIARVAGRLLLHATQKRLRRGRSAA